MSTIAAALASAVAELRAGGIDNAPGDARRLMAHALGIAPDRLTLALPEPVTPDMLARLDRAMKDRLERKPVSHILGYRQFWGRDFKVSPAVLDPRPETETLIAAALAGPFSRVLDLGTGSGCILLTLLAERAGATGTGADISSDALAVAVENRAALGLDDRAVLVQSDWFTSLAGRFDLIVSNPPYIALPEMAGLAPEVLRWEPMMALTPGPGGLEAYRAIAAGILPYLMPGGRVLLETGPTQADAVAEMFAGERLDPVALHKDMDGRDRVVELRRRA
ncbi:MAG: peptide chain release factor N(5)-glutamine methyltransferase [Rhodobacteraceae bacterium]|nr:peptide chain release factor N(5)-glutamine methyltransferase [Paracoccaceae bacterium]